MNKRMFLKFIFIACLCIFAKTAYSAERILSYETEITVKPNGVLDVVENITVHAENNKIKRGIYRDFPTQYLGENGADHRVGFELLSVMRNDENEHYSVNSYSNSVRIYIGDPDNYISQGEHTFQLHYQTDRQIQFFDHRDELYFNGIPQQFDFPMDFASVTVNLPEKAVIQEYKAFTGQRGSKEENTLILQSEPNRISFNTSKALGRYEGMTVVLAFAKGAVNSPNQQQLSDWFWRDYHTPIESLVGLFLFATTLFCFWWLVGKDPKKGTIIPRFEAPQGMSPAVCHYLANRAASTKTFAVALVSLAVKRYIDIEDSNDGYTVKKCDVTKKMSPLSAGEQMIFKRLFKSSVSVTVGQGYVEAVGSAYLQFKRKIVSQYARESYVFNRAYIGYAVVLFLVTFSVVAYRGFGGEAVVMFLFFSVFCSMFFGFSGLMAISLIKRKSYIVALFPLTFIFGFVWIFQDVLLSSGNLISLLQPQTAFVLSVSVAALCFLVFILVIGAPTQTGRKLLDEIEGFKWYLSVAEGDDLKGMTLPKKTPELYQRFLPYALALGVENKWSEQFAEVLSQAGTLTQVDTPSHNMNIPSSIYRAHALRSMAQNMDSSMTRAIRTSSSPPSSSSSSSRSGFSSSGSSGGGGGGGGGGGW